MISSSLATSGRGIASASYVPGPARTSSVRTSSNSHGSTSGVLNWWRGTYRWYSTVSPVQPCLTEDAVFPDIVHYDCHRRFLLDQLSAPLLLRACLFDELFVHEVKDGPYTDDTAALPTADAAKLEKSRQQIDVIV